MGATGEIIFLTLVQGGNSRMDATGEIVFLPLVRGGNPQMGAIRRKGDGTRRLSA